MSRPFPAARGADVPERGFVLVGVVMFILALTILGISLFSLSGYEAQFTATSADAEAAFFSACSGIEHAKFVLAKRESLGAVGNVALSPDSNVIYARARLLSGGFDDTLSAIPNLPPGTAIEIRVLAQVGRGRRMLQADYVPNQTPNLYKRLISVNDYVHVKPVWHVPPNDPLYSSMDSPTGSTAGVWQTSLDLSWVPQTQIDPSKVSTASVPLPDLAPYYSRFWNTATNIEGKHPHHFDLSGGTKIPGGPNDIEFFKTLQDPDNDGDPADNPKYSILVSGARVDLSGNGSKTAIWLVDHGVRFVGDVEFRYDPGDMLVIVSKQSLKAPTPPQNVPIGIWFFQGLDSGPLPVILVSDAQIVLEELNNPYPGYEADYLTLFARSAWLAGCRRNAGNNYTTSWLHPANHPLDARDGLIDRLCELGALPNADASGTRFSSVAGTWIELDPDNPPVFN